MSPLKLRNSQTKGTHNCQIGNYCFTRNQHYIVSQVTDHSATIKKIVYKMRPKKKTRKKQGHRQELTRVLIENISIK